MAARSATARALRRAETEERRRELLRGNAEFCEMVTREAEEMLTHATVDELAEFAFGTFDEAREQWKRRQRARFKNKR